MPSAMAYALILVFRFGVDTMAPTSTTLDGYQTLERCEAARSTVLHQYANNRAEQGGGFVAVVVAVCVPR